MVTIMLQKTKWTTVLGKSFNRVGHWLGSVLMQDLSDSKWGHRVMDQIFREGKFSPPNHR
jgi:hypothetical protein